MTWRPALRIARREALRHRLRSLTVVLMIGLPVAGITAADVVLRTQDVSPAERLQRELGHADGLVTDARYPRTHDRLAAVREAVGPGARVLTLDAGTARVMVPGGAAHVATTVTDFRDPMTDGVLAVTAGRLPASGGEAAVSRALAQRGFGVGATVAVVGGPALRVVGEVRSPTRYGTSLLAALPGEVHPQDVYRRYLVTRPGGIDSRTSEALSGAGFEVDSRRLGPVVHDGGTTDDQLELIVLVILLALIETALLAGPAFAVGTRARQRTLALLAASGAGPGDVFRSVLALAIVLGAAGVVVGAWAGVGVARLAVPIAQQHSESRFGPFEVSPRDIVAIALFGLASAVLAAVVPAWTAARQDVAAVLAGRPPRPRTGRRSPWLAAIGLVLGVLAAAAGAHSGNGEARTAAGTVFSVLGMLFAIPIVLGALGRVAGRLPMPLRFAVRDAARNRSRTTPAVAAVAATVLGVTALGISSASDTREAKARYTPTGPVGSATVTGYSALPGAAAAAARAALPQADVRTVRGLPQGAPFLRFGGRASGLDYSEFFNVFGTAVIVADAGSAGFGLHLSAAAARQADVVLAQGGAVVLDRGRAGVTQTTITAAHRPSITVPAAFVRPEVPTPAAEAIIAPVLAARLHMRVQPQGLFITGPPIAAGQAARLRTALAAVVPSATVTVEHGFHDRSAGVTRFVLGAAGMLLMLIGTLTATLLALADARSELATLVAVGAAPRTRRLVAAAYAGVISLVGAVLGVVVGTIPGLASAWSITSPSHVIAIPWLLLVSVVLGLPLIAAAGVGATSRTSRP